jgi:hypothetical protein
MNKYSEAQTNYMKADALFRMASEAHHADRSNDEKTQAWHDAMELRAHAREQLIAWAIGKCKELPKFSEYAKTIERIISHPSPAIKSKVVELSLKLRV